MKAQQFGMTCWEGGRMDKLHYTTLDDFLKVNNLFWLGQRDETEVEWVKIQSLTGAQSVISDFEDGEKRSRNVSGHSQQEDKDVNLTDTKDRILSITWMSKELGASLEPAERKGALPHLDFYLLQRTASLLNYRTVHMIHLCSFKPLVC